MKTNVQVKIRSYVLEALKKKNIHEIRITNLVKETGIARSSFYLYYDSTYDVLQEIEDDFFAELSKYRITAESEDVFLPEQMYASIYRATMFLHDNRELAKILWGPHGDPLFQVRCRRLVERNLIPESVRKLFKENPGFHASFLVGGHINSQNEWLFNHPEISPKEFTDLTYEYLCYSLGISKRALPEKNK